MSVSQSNRRELPRVLTTIKVECLDGGPFMMAQDLSLGGMLVTTPMPRWPGSLLRVRFRLPRETRPIRATCRVVDLVEVPVGVGLSLRFLKLAPEAQALILRYMDRRPMPEVDDLDVSGKIQAWVTRITEDCAQLRALAESP